MIRITGCDNRIREKIRLASEWYLKHLLQKRTREKLKIYIHLKRGLATTEKVDAECIWNEDIETPRPKNFIIHIDDKLTLRQKLLALAHEMVHLKQWATGEMYEYVRKPHLYRWRGNTIDTRKKHYYELPWEVESHGRELGMFIRMCEHYKWGKEEWTQEKDMSTLVKILKKYEKKYDENGNIINPLTTNIE